jgi:hypothetical protein
VNHILLRLALFLAFSIKCAAQQANQTYWSRLKIPAEIVNKASFTIVGRQMEALYAAEAHRTLVSCALIGCEISVINGITFYTPISSLSEEPFKQPLSELVSVKSVDELNAIVKQNPNKACFIWSSQFADFKEVLKFAEYLAMKKVPFYFGIREEINGLEIRVAFLE